MIVGIEAIFDSYKKYESGKWYKVKNKLIACSEPPEGVRISAYEREWHLRGDCVTIEKGSIVMITDHIFGDEIVRLGYQNRFLFTISFALQMKETLEELERPNEFGK